MSRRGNGEGSIYQRATDGRWVGSVHLGYDGGKRQRKVVYGATRGEVAERKKRLLADQQQHIPLQASERLTVGQFITSWLEDTAKPGVKPSTYDSYASYVEHHIVPKVGRIPLTRITPQDVEKMMAKIQASPARQRRKGKSCSPRTAAHARAILRNALADAVKWGMLARNAAALADPPRLPKAELVTFSPDEARTFIEGMEGDREAALYVLALACGLRLGEVTGLRWEDVDLDSGTLRVQQTLQRGKGEWRIGEPKSLTSRRTLALPAVAIDALKAHRVRQLEDRLKVGQDWADTMGLVFTTPFGEPVNPAASRVASVASLVAWGCPRCASTISATVSPVC